MIRRARIEDARVLSEINHLVIKDFFIEKATTQQEAQLQKELLQEIIEEDYSAFSYRNTFVVEKDGEVAGAMWIYNYDEQVAQMNEHVDSKATKAPLLLTFLEEEHAEAKSGDMYIDTLAVAEKWQGHGVSSQLLNYAKKLASQKENSHLDLSLIVDKENPHAERIYEKHGFVTKEVNDMYRSVYSYMNYDESKDQSNN